MPKNIRVNTREQLITLARRLKVRPDWREPDGQAVTARVYGDDLDNAGFWGHDAQGSLVTYGAGHQELWVEISQDGQPIAEINLATLLAWASELKDSQVRITVDTSTADALIKQAQAALADLANLREQEEQEN